MNEFIPTVTISLGQYEMMLEYRNKYHEVNAELISTIQDVELWKERYKEALKMLDEKQEEISKLTIWQEKWADRYDSD